jgi:hypothetical protein
MARRNTRLESEGAEFLVLGQLLITGIEAHKAYTRYPGYDLIATNPQRDKACRIQVKSRWATDYDGSFLIKSFDCDFVVHVALNRGYSFRRRGREGGVKAPESWVFPTDVVRAAQSSKSAWGKVFVRRIAEADEYREAWGLIRTFLELE